MLSAGTCTGKVLRNRNDVRFFLSGGREQSGSPVLSTRREKSMLTADRKLDWPVTHALLAIIISTTRSIRIQYHQSCCYSIIEDMGESIVKLVFSRRKNERRNFHGMNEWMNAWPAREGRNVRTETISSSLISYSRMVCMYLLNFPSYYILCLVYSSNIVILFLYVVH